MGSVTFKCCQQCMNTYNQQHERKYQPFSSESGIKENMSMINVNQERGIRVYEEQRGSASHIYGQNGLSNQPNQSNVEPNRRTTIFGDNQSMRERIKTGENPQVNLVGENKKKKPVDMSTNQSEPRDRKQESDPANTNSLRSSRLIQVTQVKALQEQVRVLAEKNKQLKQKVKEKKALYKDLKKDKKASTATLGTVKNPNNAKKKNKKMS